MSDKQTKRYWMSLEQRDGDEADMRAAGQEFTETPWRTPGPFSRRGFLKVAGFTFAGAMAGAAGCNRAPVRKAIPLLDQPEGVIPGRANTYASTCDGCSAGCGLLVKSRDGRPIKLEGNPDHPFSRGGLCAVGQASILGLYDSHRLRQPLANGKETSWSKADAAIAAKLAAIRQQGGAVRFLTATLASPTAGKMIQEFLKPFSNGRHVTYEALSSSAIADSHAQTHGVRLVPRYHFGKADVIASFDADFLGTWISPVEFTAGYRTGRQVEGDSPRFLRHVQFESRYSLTGGQADKRFAIAPDELGLVLIHLAAILAGHAGVPFDYSKGLPASPVAMADLKTLADQLWHAKKHSLVVSGSQDVAVQALCNFVNHLLDNYGHTLDLANPSYQNQSNDAELKTLLSELASGQVQALFLHGVNPVFELPDGSSLADAIKKVPLVVSLAPRLDETSRLARFVCPDHHYLESWGDHEAAHGVISFTQPTVSPLGDTRSLLESLAVWSGTPRSAHDILRQTWTDQSFWDQTLHDGYASIPRKPVATEAFKSDAVLPIRPAAKLADGAFALVLYPKVGMRAGRHAYNPWLHELPDPISKATWDNYACLSPDAASKLGVSEGDVVEVRLQGQSKKTIQLPVLIQMGQHDRVVAVALGYGTEESARFKQVGAKWLHDAPSVGANGLVGTNAAPLLSLAGPTLRYSDRHVQLSRTGKRHTLALTQEHHTITVPEHLAPEGGLRRPNIQETTLAALHDPATTQPHGPAHDHELWPRDHKYLGRHWGMAIDLTACTGCASCVIACQVENNIPVVGKDEVRRNREMHWIRIDRYYSETTDGDIDVAHQPMMCQHCDHAPCETVCPVLATVHGEEGLNQQAYNRCVGTRYCSNNCPYKVRRFNWFDYPHDDVLQNMTLNPDVTIRSRGVMEKCSMCVQRIQEAKIEAKRRGVVLADGDIQPACQQSCPAGAIVFGDTNDPDSRVSRLIAGGRHFHVLEEINVRPSVGYLSLVRNRPEAEDSASHG